MRILYAEDSRMIAATVMTVLSDMGHHVDHVVTGRAAIAAYQRHQPDLILMDVVMPEMDGIEATRQIKQLGGKRWVPLIIMTGLSSERELLAGLEAGADDYLIKPTSVEVLQARIRAMQRIAEMQDTLFEVIDHVYDAIVTITDRGEILGFNKGAERIFGYSAQAMLGKNVRVLMPSPHREQHDAYISRYLEHGQPHIIGKGRKLPGVRNTGEVFPMHLTVTEVPNARQGRVFIGLVRDISIEEAARARIEFLANHDGLTGLPNRMNLAENLDARLHSGASGHLYFIDLDGFKPVNDQLGHEAGDQALIEVANRLKTQCGPDDFVGRLGGDEFVVITAHTGDAAAAGEKASALIAAVSAPMALLTPPVTRQLGASIGIASLSEHGTAGRTALLTYADNAMYQAKAKGKGGWVFAAHIIAPEEGAP